jgi:CopG family nickel-responsive transcriptional regulator
MSDLERFGVSMPADLLDEFDRAITAAGYANRSEAVRDLARKYLTERRWALEEGEVVGTITLIYDHHVPDLAARLTQMQHDAVANVICTTHVHLDHHNCAEVIVVRGEAGEVRRLADRIIATRGVKHGELTCTAAQP